MTTLDYFYDDSFRRIVLHFGRLFMGFQVSNGKDAQGNDILQRVPCRFATSDRQALQILRNNSENTILSAPFISYYITNVDLARDRTRNAYSVNEITMSERRYVEGQGYTGEQGNSFNVTRVNPVPLDIEFNLDIWTTMVEHKHQLLYQIRTIYNPALTMQLSTAPMDWTALQEVELTNISFSSRNMPVGTDDAMDIMSMTFKVQSWLSAPAKVTRSKLIQTIFTNIGEGDSEEDIFGWNLPSVSRSVFTPGDYYIRVSEDYSQITLLDPWGVETTTTWPEVLNEYGKYSEGVTQLRLRALVDDETNTESDIIGTVEVNNSDETILDWTIDVDTLPSATLDAVDGVIDPFNSFPGSGLPNAATGQRYLLLSAIGSVGSSTVAWGSLVAGENDIIEYNGSSWEVDFDSSANSTTQYVGTLAGNKRYQWTSENGWIDPISGTWRNGWWRIAIGT
jgi:hypothetical protein